jgi:transposase
MRINKEAISLFIKTTRVKNYEYIKLVESYWEDGRSKCRVLYNFGRLDIIKQDESFVRAIEKLCEIIGGCDKKESSEDEVTFFDNCGEAEFYNYGYLAYLKLWRELGIDDAMGYLQSERMEHSVSDAVFLMAVQHLLEPRSKLSTYQHQNRYLNLTEIPLQTMYRSLDKLSEYKETIESELFEYNYTRLGRTVDVVFYDVTTFAFESVHVDELKDFGYSKACKFNEVQVVMGLLIDSNDMLIGYQLFSGNTFDGKTMTDALANIKRLRFGIKRVIIVADRGLNSKYNLNMIKDAGYGYIMSSKIKGMSKNMQAKILNTEGFTVINGTSGKEDFRYKTMPYTNVFVDGNKGKHYLDENLIITYSTKRAKKDQKDRERLIDKAKNLLENPEKINALNKRGGKKYIDKTEPGKPDTWILASEKIEQDAQFDGYYGIQTSEKSMSATDIVEAYHTLWKIEESFRIMKSTMEVRPIFHWTPKRIEGHFVLCFLAFLMERKLEFILNIEKDDVSVSPDRIQESLNNMQVVALTANNERLFIKAKTDPLANKIFKLLGLNLPLNISTPPELFTRLELPEEPTEFQMSLV